MKKIILLIGVLAFVFTIHSFRVVDRKFADVLSQLGVSETDGKSSIWTSFLYEQFQYPSNKTIRSLTTAKRGEVAKELAAYTKKYLLSNEFKKLYQERRTIMKPKELDPNLKPEAWMNSSAEGIKMQISQQEEMLKKANEKTKPNIERTITRLKSDLKSYTDTTDKKYAINIKPYKTMYETELGKYNAEMEKFNKKYPANPNDMIRDRLEKFLSLSAEVDFNAELKPGPNGLKVFVNPEYEKKSKDWKACYRAGKETIAVVRAEATKFLKELK